MVGYWHIGWIERISMTDNWLVFYKDKYIGMALSPEAAKNLLEAQVEQK